MAFRRKVFKPNDPLRKITATHMQDITDVLHYLDVFNGHIDRQGNFWTIVLDQLNPNYKGFDADTSSSPDSTAIANRRSIETDTDGWVSQYGWSSPTEDSVLADSLHHIELRRIAGDGYPEQRYILPSKFAAAMDTHLLPVLDTHYLKRFGSGADNPVGGFTDTDGNAAIDVNGRKLEGGPWNIEGGIQADGDTGHSDSTEIVVLPKKNEAGNLFGYFRSGLFIKTGED